MFRALAILVPALLTAACGTRPQTTERKGRIIALTDSVLTAGGTDTGDARQVTLTFDSRGEWGWQLKTLDISLAGAQQPLRLLVEADIK